MACAHKHTNHVRRHRYTDTRVRPHLPPSPLSHTHTFYLQCQVTEKQCASRHPTTPYPVRRGGDGVGRGWLAVSPSSLTHPHPPPSPHPLPPLPPSRCDAFCETVSLMSYPQPTLRIFAPSPCWVTLNSYNQLFKHSSSVSTPLPPLPPPPPPPRPNQRGSTRD